MSNYVNIASSIPDIISAAHRIQGRGEQLSSEMGEAIDAVDALDTDATLATDDFAQAFKHGDDGTGYHAEVETEDREGNTVMLPANDAVKQSARTLGEAMTTIGQNVSDAMWSYAAADDDSATEINNAAGT